MRELLLESGYVTRQSLGIALAIDRDRRPLAVEVGLGAFDPAAFVGRAPQQVDEFLREVVGPLLEGVEVMDAEEVRV